MRAVATMRERQAEEAETEAEIDEEVVEDVEDTKAFQVYAWTYSGIPILDGRIIAKIGYAGTGPTSDAWHRMANTIRTTGAPGAPTMLRVWVGRGGPDEAKRIEGELHKASGRRVLGGGDEWFETQLDALDSGAARLALERRFGVNPA
jgi:hypothetical protein